MYEYTTGNYCFVKPRRSEFMDCCLDAYRYKSTDKGYEMREIKFRAWHVKQQKMYSTETMVKDQFALLPDGRFANIDGDDTAKSTIFESDSIIPLQYTGLKDINSVEIYEGDIIEVWDWGMQPETQKLLGVTSVVWDLDDCGWRYEHNSLTEDFYDQFRRVKVIGNLYENKELLE